MFTPNVNILSTPVPHNGPFPGGIAVGGKLAGRILGTSPTKEQRLAYRGPLPRPGSVDLYESPGEMAYETMIYEYSSLHLHDDLYIPFWKPYGMSVVEAASLLFQGYYDGKKTEARKW